MPDDRSTVNVRQRTDNTLTRRSEFVNRNFCFLRNFLVWRGEGYFERKLCKFTIDI